MKNILFLDTLVQTKIIDKLYFYVFLFKLRVFDNLNLKKKYLGQRVLLLFCNNKNNQFPNVLYDRNNNDNLLIIFNNA